MAVMQESEQTGRFHGWAKVRTTQDDSTDGIGRAESGTEAEQLSRCAGTALGYRTQGFMQRIIQGTLYFSFSE